MRNSVTSGEKKINEFMDLLFKGLKKTRQNCVARWHDYFRGKKTLKTYLKNPLYDFSLQRQIAKQNAGSGLKPNLLVWLYCGLQFRMQFQYLALGLEIWHDIPLQLPSQPPGCVYKAIG
jgi:hypothetical protein